MLATAPPLIEFAREKLSDILDDIAPMLIQHWREVAPYKDIPVAPRLDHYVAADENDLLRCYTLRENEEMIGYAIFFVVESLQSKGVILAKHELLYISPTKREGLRGFDFIAACDKRLKAEGVDIVSHLVRPDHDYSPILKRLGYTCTGYDFSRRLDLEREV